MKKILFILFCFTAVSVDAQLHRRIFLKAEPKEYSKNNIDFYVFLGDSKVTGGVNTESGGWDIKYSDTLHTSLILYKNDRTSESATVRFMDYNQHLNRFPGYGPINSASPHYVGYDNSFMWYMRTNSKRPHGLIKWALGGTTLQVKTSTTNDWAFSTDEMYRSAIDYYLKRAAKAAYDLGYRNPRFVAAFVSLGTNDVATANWIQANFISEIPLFVNNLRAAVANSTFPIYWQQIRSDLYLNGISAVTQANQNQGRTALSNYDATDANFTLSDYESTTTTVAGDGVHEDEVSCEEIGLDLATIFLGL